MGCSQAHVGFAATLGSSICDLLAHSVPRHPGHAGMQRDLPHIGRNAWQEECEPHALGSRSPASSCAGVSSLAIFGEPGSPCPHVEDRPRAQHGYGAFPVTLD